MGGWVSGVMRWIDRSEKRCMCSPGSEIGRYPRVGANVCCAYRLEISCLGEELSAHLETGALDADAARTLGLAVMARATAFYSKRRSRA